MEKNIENIIIGQHNFWQKWFSKFLYTLISVKVWGLVACTWVSTYLVVQEHISNGQWLTFNTTIWALIFGMKEIFRIAENRDIRESENLKKQFESEFKLAAVKNGASCKDSSKSTFTAEGFEIVGEEPDSQV